jgi:GH15 family glucan-1,4-alpha-glucosidase
VNVPGSDPNAMPVTTSSAGPSFTGPGPVDYPPIADYAFLSDREAMALVAPAGNVEWLCVPRPDSPSVFGSILDRGAGGFRVGPAELSVPAGIRYVPGTNVLETTWQTRSGWLLVRDALLIGRWEADAREAEYVRTPDDHRAEHVLLRTVKCINGQVDLEVRCEPVFGYGRREARWSYAGPGYGEAVAAGDDDDPALSLVTDLRLGLEGRSAMAYTRMEEGERAFVALSWSDGDPPADAEDASRRLRLTADFWRGWVVTGDFPDHPWRPVLQRSALTLKGLTYAPTGALLAAPTTSLPETPGGERNWDYRYSWVRDATFALWGLYTLNFAHEANAFFHFIADRINDGAQLQVMYGVHGETQLQEVTLEHLSGYEGSKPVRIGNDAWRQHQHDAWGALLDSVLLHLGAGEHLAGVTWAELVRLADEAAARWREPDHGMWEIRGEPRHYTSSKIMCWVACDRAARLAEVMDEPGLAARWHTAADEIRQDVLANGVDRSGVLTQSYGRGGLDASLLLAPLLGFLPPEHPTIRATVLAIAEDLAVDGLLLRYRVEETDDGFDQDEGAFAICSFWLVSALVEIGEVDRARAVCEKLLSYASPLGLYAEEIDPASGRHLGNFPQAFTHLALINALMHVIRAEGDRSAAGVPGFPAWTETLDGGPSPSERTAAVDAVGRPRHGLEPLGGDGGSTSDAGSVGAVGKTGQRRIHLFDRASYRAGGRRAVDALDRLRRTVTHTLAERYRRRRPPRDVDQPPQG